MTWWKGEGIWGKGPEVQLGAERSPSLKEVQEIERHSVRWLKNAVERTEKYVQNPVPGKEPVPIKILRTLRLAYSIVRDMRERKRRESSEYKNQRAEANALLERAETILKAYVGLDNFDVTEMHPTDKKQ